MSHIVCQRKLLCCCNIISRDFYFNENDNKIIFRWRSLRVFRLQSVEPLQLYRKVDENYVTRTDEELVQKCHQSHPLCHGRCPTGWDLEFSHVFKRNVVEFSINMMGLVVHRLSPFDTKAKWAGFITQNQFNMNSQILRRQLLDRRPLQPRLTWHHSVYSGKRLKRLRRQK